MVFNWEFHQTFKELTPILQNIFQNTEEGMLSPYEQAGKEVCAHHSNST